MAAPMENTHHAGSARRRWWRPWMVRPGVAWSAFLVPLSLAITLAAAVPSATTTAEDMARVIGLVGGIFAALVVADDLRVHGERSNRTFQILAGSCLLYLSAVPHLRALAEGTGKASGVGPISAHLGAPTASTRSRRLVRRPVARDTVPLLERRAMDWTH